MKYDPKVENNLTKQTVLFFKSAFNLDLNLEELEKLPTHVQQVEYAVEEGKNAKKFPENISVPYFLRLLEMQSVLIEAVEGYVPTLLNFDNCMRCKILYMHCTPNSRTPMPWYPNPETWEDFIPKMNVVKYEQTYLNNLFIEELQKRCIFPGLVV